MVPRPASAERRSWRTSLTGGLLAALLFLAAWLPTHPARPHLATSDLFTHLTVARHLVRGDGFLTDVAYPLSFAFPFARTLPQPLLHRQPGFALALTLPVLAADEDPEQAVANVRWFQVAALGGLVFAGAAALIRRRQEAGLLLWLVLLGFNPALGFAVDWGFVELSCALLMLMLWLRRPVAPTFTDGLLAGMLTLLRLDLFWVPLAWWLSGGGLHVSRRRWLPALLVWLAVTAPWAVRNAQLTGNPVFSLQGYAEHVKDTRNWPGYDVYRQLDPQPLFTTLATDPVPVLRKAARGVKFYCRDLHRLLPLPLVVALWAAAGLWLWQLQRCLARKRRPALPSPLAAAGLTLVLMILQYAIFDHDLRHLLVLAPVVIWEVSRSLGRWIVAAVVNDPAERQERAPWLLSAAGAALLALGIVSAFPCRLPGWSTAAEMARAETGTTATRIEQARQAPPGVLFSATSAVPWYADRPVVWAPLDNQVRSRILVLLSANKETP